MAGCRLHRHNRYWLSVSGGPKKTAGEGLVLIYIVWTIVGWFPPFARD
jgi:hypothetical protein